MKSSKSSSNRGCLLLLMILILPALGYGVYQFARNVRLKQELASARVIASALRSVCNGTPADVLNRATRSAMGDNQLIMVNAHRIGSDALHNWNSSLPQTVVAGATELTTIVVCLESSTQLLQTCRYTPPPDIQRFLPILKVTLHEAQTGQVIATHTLNGGKPRECLQSESLSIARLDGTPVTYDAFYSWLTSVLP